MNKKLILSMALLTGLSQSYAKIQYRHIIAFGATAVALGRTLWHGKTSQYETPQYQTLDAILGLGQDFGIVAQKVGNGLITGGEWLATEAKGTRGNLPHFFNESPSNPPHPFTNINNEDNAEGTPVEDSGE